MATVEFTNLEGQLCRFQWPPRDLSDLEEMHRGCGASAEEEQDMEDVMVGPMDLVRFSHGEAVGSELVKIAEKQEAHRIATRYKDDGLGTYAEGYQKYLDRHPGARARIAGLDPSLEDILHRQGKGQGYTVVDAVGTKYHVSGEAPKAEAQPDPEGEDVVTIIPQGSGLRYVIHGRVKDHAKKPGTDKAQEAEAARKELWRRANELSKMSPSDAMLQAVLERPELLAIIQEAREE